MPLTCAGESDCELDADLDAVAVAGVGACAGSSLVPQSEHGQSTLTVVPRALASADVAAVVGRARP